MDVLALLLKSKKYLNMTTIDTVNIIGAINTATTSISTIIIKRDITNRIATGTANIVAKSGMLALAESSIIQNGIKKKSQIAEIGIGVVLENGAQHIKTITDA